MSLFLCDQLQKQFFPEPFTGLDPVGFTTGYYKAASGEELQAIHIAHCYIAIELMQLKGPETICYKFFKCQGSKSLIPVSLVSDKNSYSGPKMVRIKLKQVNCTNGADFFFSFTSIISRSCFTW